MRDVEEKRINSGKAQNVYIENRKKITLSGVLDVDSFNDENVVLYTDNGAIHITGEDLHINRLNLDDGDLVIEGFINSINYSEKDDFKVKGMGFLGRMFR